MLAAMSVVRMLGSGREPAAAPGRPFGLGRIVALLTLVALPFADGCIRNDDGIVQDTLGGGGGGQCGNGIVDADEDCDDQNDDPRDDCTNECQAPACGDGVANAGEACDDADDDDADSCTAACDLGPGAVATVGTGEHHVCALSEQGQVRCWGAPDYGRLGQPGYSEHIGDDEPPSDWNPVEVAADVIDLAVGTEHNCALRAGGEVRCWGYGSYGQLGYGNTMTIGDDETPQSAGDVPLPGPVAGLTAGARHTCALFDDGRVACWGSNSEGQLGLGHTTSIGDDETVDAAAGFVQLPGAAVEVAAGQDHTCARLESGDVYCWGRQNEGQLGSGAPDSIGDDEPADAAGPVDLGGKAIDIDAGHHHTCAVLEDGSVRCWGSNSSLQLGNGDQTGKNVGDRKTPAEDGLVMLEEPAVQVAAGRSHTCAVLGSGGVRCWGSSSANGVSDSGDSAVPRGLARVGAPVRQLWAASGYNCAVVDTAGVRCWGSNTGAVLGYPEVPSYTTVKDAGMYGDVDVF